MLQPAGYVRGPAASLARNVDIHENSPVTEFERRGPDWRATTHGGHVAAPRIILTMNGRLESFGVERGRLVQLFLFASMTSALDRDALDRLGGRSRGGSMPSNPMGTTMRRIDERQGGDRIITRTAAVMRLGMQASEAGVKRAAVLHRRKFDDRFP